MAWTTPRTFVPGELVTATMLNTHIRDQLNYLIDSNLDFVGVAAGKKLFLDAGSDTYIYEEAANQVRCTVGGVLGWRVFSASGGGFVIPSAAKLYVDGGTDTYLHEVSANVLQIVTGGVAKISWISSGTRLDTLGTTASAANLYCAGAGNVIERSTSSIRYKRDVQDVDLADAKEVVRSLRPITYRGRSDRDQRQWLGFIAEEVAPVEPLLVQWSKSDMQGQEEYVTYDRVPVLLVPVVQDLMRSVERLEALLPASAEQGAK